MLGIYEHGMHGVGLERPVGGQAKTAGKGMHIDGVVGGLHKLIQ